MQQKNAMRYHESTIRDAGNPHLERQRLWTAGRQLLATANELERLRGARLVVRALDLPPGVELDESLCRRAGIPTEWLEELRGPELRAA